MRIVNRSEFLELPSGTIYSNCKGNDEIGLYIKGDTYPNCTICTTWKYESIIRKSWHGEVEGPLEYYSYDKDEEFVIWSPEDVVDVINKLQLSLSALSKVCVI